MTQRDTHEHENTKYFHTPKNFTNQLIFFLLAQVFFFVKKEKV